MRHRDAHSHQVARNCWFKLSVRNGLVDFGPFPGVRNAERNGRKRENRTQNRPSSAVGEVRKFPQEPARTRGGTRQQTKKIPNSDELGIVYWWSWRELNPRPQAIFVQFYMCSRLI
jgi:hypothetical protein